MLDNLSRYQPQALAVLRIMTALLLMEHGTQKLFGFPASTMEGGGGELGGLMLVAGILEAFGGLLILVGFLTRPVAFILCGFMAVAYFMAHAPQNFFPVNNMGDAAILYCFIFLYLFFAGPGAWSVDSAHRHGVRRRAAWSGCRLPLPDRRACAQASRVGTVLAARHSGPGRKSQRPDAVGVAPEQLFALFVAAAREQGVGGAGPGK